MAYYRGSSSCFRWEFDIYENAHVLIIQRPPFMEIHFPDTLDSTRAQSAQDTLLLIL